MEGYKYFPRLPDFQKKTELIDDLADALRDEVAEEWPLSSGLARAVLVPRPFRDYCPTFLVLHFRTAVETRDSKGVPSRTNSLSFYAS